MTGLGPRPVPRRCAGAERARVRRKRAGGGTGALGGISLGGILIIVGSSRALIWSWWLGLIIALIGLIAFGGFARGRWY
ncbi:MAG: hypothetical protein M3292_02445 [Actinomycetota bacterium]|nr:hypothetical protein [Actinomycetota bacterium]